MNWIEINNMSNVPQSEVIGFHPDWIDMYYNENGIKLGFFEEDQDGRISFVSASWDEDFKWYEVTASQMPTHFLEIPQNPLV